MKKGCCTACGGQNNDASAQKREFSPVIEQDEPLVFDIQKNPAIAKTAKSRMVEKQPVKTQKAEPQKEVAEYEKVTVIDDEPLKPREASINGWFWTGIILMSGGIVWKAL